MFSWNTVYAELLELRAAWKSVVFIALLLIVGTWWAASAFYAERIAILEQRVTQAQEKTKTSEPATKSESLRTDALTAWGSGGLPDNCGADLNREALADYAGKYDVSLACGFGFAN